MRIKLLTLNIFNGEHLDSALDFLKKENPDIFCLQEVHSSENKSLNKKYRALEIIKEEFKTYFYYYSPEFFRDIEGNKVNHGHAVFSRFPQKKQNTVFYFGSYRLRAKESVEEFLQTPRSLQFVEVDCGQFKLNTFNNHGIWGTDGRDNEDRLNMSKVIVEQIKDKKNVILAGDMNMDPDTGTFKNIEKYLVNIFKNELKSTFNLKIKQEAVKNKSYIYSNNDLQGFSRAAVDMILVSPNIKIVEKYCPQVDVSDHYPLVVVLEM